MSEHTIEQPQENYTAIYALVDPNTGHERYIGKSNDPIHRFKAHTTPRELRAKTHKNHWIKGLLDNGQKPILKIIEYVPNCEWEKSERKWIAYYNNLPNRPQLTNGTSGGDGVDKGTRPSEETRKKLSDVRKGKKLPPFSQSHRDAISEANKKFWYNLPYEIKQTRNSFHPRCKKRKDNTSGFRGVSENRCGYWLSYINFKGVHYCLGTFNTSEEAARVRDRKAITLFGPDAFTNFPKSDYA